LDLVCRKIALDIHARIVNRTPVGNPELWAANADAQYRRETHNLFVDRINADINANADNFTASGTLKRGVKRARRKSIRALAKEYPFAAGRGYVGGALRMNWQLTIGAPPVSIVPGVDPTGDEAKAAAAAALATFTAGPTIYITNHLPYARRVEYGWSHKQTPLGMVRVTMAEFGAIAQDAVNSTSTT
jgi:hypothetical protein